jgi:hypothetical protein
MSGTITVKPADGARVRQPDRGNLPIPPEGAIVADNSYYRRAILTGDLVEIPEAKPEEGAVETTDAIADSASPSDDAAHLEAASFKGIDFLVEPPTPESSEAAADAPKGRRRPASNPEQE